MMSLSAPIAKSRPVANAPAGTRPLPSPGTSCAVMPGARGAQTSITVEPLPGEEIMETFERLAVALKEAGTTVVSMTVFGSTSASAPAMEAMRRIFERLDWPATWVEGAACDGRPVAGLQAFGFTGGNVERIRVGGRVVGSVFEDGEFRHCLLGGMGPNENSSPPAVQTRQTLDNMRDALGQGGFQFADVVRTWFFLDDMLSWYREFNQARTHVYGEVKFCSGSLPASTGIGGRNPAGTALAAGAWAVQPLTTSARAREIASPLQCPAPAYGSSFSRALELSADSGRRLFISGTASIAPEGQTLWLDDVSKQVAQTMEVVKSILRSRGFDFADLTRATAYFKRTADVRAFAEWRAAHHDFSIPAVQTHCDVCRDNLLFELEADAWRPK
jgi:enamine deaminase RidA (YjgF/YER057c/UK114 family)